MATLNPYLNFNSNCEEAFNFYKSVFGGEFAMMMRFGEAPCEVSGDSAEANKVMHVSLPVGDCMLMGSDCPDSYGMKITSGNNYNISINAESREEADRLFSGLSAGGNALFPMQDQFWGDYFGMLSDKFGVQWMISFSNKQEG
jgi:PhnB protein